MNGASMEMNLRGMLSIFRADRFLSVSDELRYCKQMTHKYTGFRFFPVIEMFWCDVTLYLPIHAHDVIQLIWNNDTTVDKRYTISQMGNFTMKVHGLSGALQWFGHATAVMLTS